MPNELIVPPALPMLAGALLMPFLPRRFGDVVSLAAPLLALALVWLIPAGDYFPAQFMGYPLLLLRADQLSRVFGIIFALITFIGCLFSLHLKEKGQTTAALFYAAGAMGVTFAGDFITMFVFWEMEALSSTFLIWARHEDASRRAGMRYLLTHVFGGSLFLAGLLFHTGEAGRIAVEQLSTGSFSSWLILAGVGLNAAFIPLHAWLPDAYPRATVTGAVFLSALTTKTSVYVLLRVFPGWEVLIFMGVFMTLYGVIFAVLVNDIRQILAYHIISQVGYMVAGAGIGTELAINGAAAHAFSHILYKALLFMGAGAVIKTTGKSRLTELGGLGAAQPFIFLLYMIGAFSISGFPLFNGFISKSMVVAAAGEAGRGAAMLLLLLASVGTFLSVGLKLPYFTWCGQKEAPSAVPLPLNMYIAMAAAAFFCLFHGLFPGQLYALLPYRTGFTAFTAPHLAETLQILVFTFAGFLLLRDKLAGKAGAVLDMDWFYRRPAGLLKKLCTEDFEALFNGAEALAMRAVSRLALFAGNPAALFKPAKEYSPDKQRPALGTLILSALLIVCLFSLWGLIAAAISAGP